MSVFGQRPVPDTPEDAEAQAARWVARQQLGLMGRDEEAQFRRWCEEPRNAAAWAEAREMIDKVREAASQPGIVTMRADALARTRQSPLLLGNVPVRVAAGILLVLGVALIGWTHLKEPRPRAAVPEVARVDHQSLPEIARPAAPVAFETLRGERRTVELPDGSQLTLNTASRAEIAFEADQRVVRLTQGQAFFNVAHDAQRPFKVIAGQLQVTALGTRFDVRMEPRASSAKLATTVTLVEGKVSVEPLQRYGLARLFPALARRELSPGQQIVADDPQEITVAVADLERSTSWQSGFLIFRGQPLADAVAEVNIYSDRQLVLADRELSALPVSGVFSTDHPENFVAAVAAFYPVHIEQRSPHLTILHLKKK